MKCIASLFLSLTLVVTIAFADSSDVLKKLEEAFASSSLGAYSIDADYYQGQVTLKGEVSSAEAKMVAEEVARRTEGVRQVRNLLRVNQNLQQPTHAEPMAMPKIINDNTIEQSLLRAINREQILNPGSFTVSVKNGQVTLSGNASTFRQIDRALSVALMIEGVESVKSNMTVKGEPYPH